MFRKSPKNLAYFKNYAPTLPLPPRPVVIRWGTWLQAGLYFAQHMEVLNELLPNLPSSTAASTKIIDILENKRPQLESELAIIMFHYKTLVTAIDELQGYMTSPAALEKLKKVESTLTHPVGFEKLQYVIQKNTGLLELRELKEAFEIGRGIDSARAIRVSEWTVEERVAVLRNCPIHAAC